MATFTFRARRPDGKLTQGTLRASDRGSAVSLLRKNQLTPIAIKANEEQSVFQKTILSSPIGTRDLIIFARQIASMIRAGVPILDSLRALQTQVTKDSFRQVLQDLVYEIEAGDSLSSSMAQHADVFTPFMLGVVRTGEASGRLSESLDIVADYMEKDYAFVRRVRAAFIYPIFVVIIVIMLSIILFTFVLPQLVTLFQESGVVLPLPTRILIFVTNAMSQYWYMFLAALIAFFLITRSYLKTPEGRLSFNTLLLKIPFLSDFFQKFYLSRLTSILNTLFASDVPVLESLRLARDAVTNYVYKNILDRTITAVKDGTSISAVWKKEAFIPPLLISMVEVGERSGEVQKGFAEASRFFQRDVDDLLGSITVLLEPLLILILGLGVAIVVASVILPIYNLVLVL